MGAMPAPASFDLIRKTRTSDHRIFQGSTWNLTLSFPSDWGTDWTGFAARAHLRRGPLNRFPGDPVATITAAIVDPGPVQRIVELYLSAEATEQITALRGTWDLEIYNGTVVKRIAHGQWHMNQETTS